MKPRIPSTARLSLPFATAIAALLAPNLNADQIWDGGSLVDSNWNTAANWGADTLPTFTNAITFTGATRLDPFNDLAADSTIGGINFSNTATNAFNLTGARITLGGNITTTAATSATVAMTDTIGLNMILNGDRTITTATNHNLIVSGIISQDASNRNLIKAGAGTLTLSNANSYAGSTSISAGTLRLTNSGALGSTSSISITGTSSVLQLATDVAATGLPTLNHGFSSSSGATIVSDRLNPGSAGITYALGNLNLGTVQINFTKGTNVTSGTAGISFNNITPQGTGPSTTTTLNPTTANLIILGNVTPGGTNVNAFTLGGTSAGNSIGGDITIGTRTTQNVSKTGTSVWTLSGNNSASLGTGSTTTVSGGALIATTLAALPNSGAVTISGGTLGARVGGAGWTTAEVDTLLGSATKTSGALGIDTTNGNLTQWADFTTTNLGSALGLTKLGTNTLILNSTGNNYTGTTLVSNGTLQLDVDHSLAGALTFGYANGTTSQTGTLDLNNVNATFAGGLNVDGNSITPYQIQIDSGKSLTTNGAVVIGASAPATGSVSSLAMTGGGEFIHNGTTFLVGGAGNGQLSTLDLTGLSKATITTSGNFRVAPNTGTNNNGEATLLLPTPVVADTVATTTITSGGTNGISVGNGGSNNGNITNPASMNTLQLGTGLTRLNATSINIASNPVTGSLRDNGQIIYGQAAGDLIIRAADGTSRMTSINLGTLSSAATTGVTTLPSIFDVSGHDADILVGTINVGNGLNRTTDATYEFKFGEGDNSLTGGFSSTLDATSVNIGTRAAGNSSTATQTYKMDLSGGTVLFGNVAATGTGVSIGNSAYNQAGAATFDSQLNISGGNVTIHNGTGGFAVRLGQSTSAVVGGIVNASMNLTGGTTTLTGDLVKGTATGIVNSTLAVNGGILDMGGNDITSLTGITYTAGTVKNLGTVNTGMTLAGTGSRVFDQGTAVSGEIQGAITGTGLGLTKQGDGMLTLSGNNDYTGATTISGGTLLINGNSSLATGAVAVNAGTLGGTGTLGAAVTVAALATLAPGASIESLATGALTMASTSVFAYEVANNSATGADLLASVGLSLNSVSLSLDSASLAALGGSGWSIGNRLTLISYLGADITSGFTGYDDDTSYVFGTNEWLFNYNDTVAGDNFGADAIAGGQDRFVTMTVIPEPNVAALIGAFGGIILLRRRRN